MIDTGFETPDWLQPACESPAPCTTAETCGASVGKLWSGSREFYPNADISCKENRYKKS